MEKPSANYKTLIQITKSLSTLHKPEDIILIAVEGISHALKVKGCTLFLFNPKTNELNIAGSYGLSDEYLNKGPVSSLKSISESLQDGEPIAIYDISDDPRIQYPEAAKKEGIASILSSPIIIRNKLLGCLRIYTADHWEFELGDVSFVQAVAQMVGMALEMCRVRKGLKESIDILKGMRDISKLKQRRRTPFEGVPKSFSKKEIFSEDSDIHILS